MGLNIDRCITNRSIISCQMRYRNSLYFRAKISVIKFFMKKYFRMIYVNDCPIRVVRSCIKIFVQILHTKCVYKTNYGIHSIIWLAVT